MNLFLSGGCKNGKSFLAQRLARAQAEMLQSPLYYLATMRPADEEDRLRVLRHQSERAGWGFETIEQPTQLCACLRRANAGGVFLLDSLTAWLANEMFRPEGVDTDCGGRLEAELFEFLARTGNAVVVSDFIYSDAARYDPLTEQYRRTLARLDRAAAAACGAVLEVVAGNAVIHKGDAAFFTLWERSRTIGAERRKNGWQRG